MRNQWGEATNWIADSHTSFSPHEESSEEATNWLAMNIGCNGGQEQIPNWLSLLIEELKYKMAPTPEPDLASPVRERQNSTKIDLLEVAPKTTDTQSVQEQDPNWLSLLTNELKSEMVSEERDLALPARKLRISPEIDLFEEAAPITDNTRRITPTYTMQTCTGRISMHKPNLQNVPRTFSIPNEYLESSLEHSHTEFNCRNMFKASEGYVMVSADYCQLEMRVLTHFSEDTVLLEIMRSGVDVFKSIAASWSTVPEDEVDDDLRQKAKQLCYGILYGMGNKTLGLHLDVNEMEAAIFMESFYKTFPFVKKYTQTIIDECCKKGYVETLMNRRRQLPDIKNKNPSRRSAAERQAVNTSIQGSAADIAKAAMCAIDEKTKCHKHKPRLLLQMHDELIYEVLEENKQVFSKILKDVMEGTVKLKVPLPVKVKSGYSWGSLKEIKV